MATPTLQSLTQIPITDHIDPSDLQTALSNPPFLPLPTALNIRDLGLVPSSPIRPGLIFTSGFLTTLSPTDQTALRDTYNIKRIYDLRSAVERTRAPEPEIEGVEMVWVQVEREQGIDIASFAQEDGVQAYVDGYRELLRMYVPAYGRVLRDLAGVGEGGKDGADGGILYHCTAGKDRTGVLSALLLDLAGADADTIAFNYALSRIGVEPRRAVLMASLKASFGADVPEDTPGFKEMCSIKAEFMRAFVDVLRGEFGGAKGYCRDHVGLTEEEIRVLRRTLRGEE